MIEVYEYDPLNRRYFRSWLNPMNIVSVYHCDREHGASLILAHGYGIDVKEAVEEIVSKLNAFLRKNK